MKFEILKFKSVTSTNDVAVNLIKEKKKLIGCVCSELQTKGRGTYGKNGFQKKVIYFLPYFFLWMINVHLFMNFQLLIR